MLSWIEALRQSVRNTIIGESSFKNSTGIFNKKVKGIGFQEFFDLFIIECGSVGEMWDGFSRINDLGIDCNVIRFWNGERNVDMVDGIKV